jgi:hypothetical protein
MENKLTNTADLMNSGTDLNCGNMVKHKTVVPLTKPLNFQF